MAIVSTASNYAIDWEPKSLRRAKVLPALRFC
jgi:hypothetical protein